MKRVIKEDSLFLALCIFGLLIQSSCTKSWLDVKTDKNLAVPSTLKDYQALLDNALIMNIATPALSEVASDGHYTKEVYWQLSAFPDYERNAYTWAHNYTYININDWNKTYQKIFYANNVLDGIKKINLKSEYDQQTLNNIKGQALFIRSLNFYYLSQQYATPYNISSASTDLGIPLRLESDVNISTKRSTVQQTYDQIINDLTEALDLLPDFPLYWTRGSKVATYALLARIYLSMENYQKAQQFADLSLQLYNTLIDYNTINPSSSLPLGPINGKPNSETLFFSISNSYLSLPGIATAGVDTSLYQLYQNNDLRKNCFFLVNSDGSISFKGTYGNQNGPAFTGLATDEIYLIRAECNARNGNANLAMEDLNKLLIKRWKPGTFVPFTASSPDNALIQILTERKKELLVRCLRWSDLRRLNRDSRFASTLTRTIGGKTYTLSPNDNRYTLPIPDDIIQQTSIQQNNGW